MTNIDGVLTLIDDVYSRSQQALDSQVLPAVHEFLEDMEEATILAIGRKGSIIHLTHWTFDHGITAPPPDVPSRTRKLEIHCRDHIVAGDTLHDLRQLIDIQGKYIEKPNGEDIQIGQFSLGKHTATVEPE